MAGEGLLFVTDIMDGAELGWSRADAASASLPKRETALHAAPPNSKNSRKSSAPSSGDAMLSADVKEVNESEWIDLVWTLRPPN